MPTTLVDHRGFAFLLPKLGLLDPADTQGADLIIRVAIGSNKEAVSLVKDDSKEAPRRYAGDLNDYLDLQYEGALWILPVVLPRTKDQTELFTIKARRLHPSFVRRPHRMRLPDGATIFYIQPPGGIEATFHKKALKGTAVPTEEDEIKYWDTDWDYLLNRGPKDPGNGSDKQKLAVAPYPVASHDEKLDFYGAVKEEWEKAVKGLAVTERIKATGMIPRNEPKVVIRGSVGSEVKIKYALAWQKVDPLTIPEEEWEMVPRYAYKPGAELKVFNRIRKAVGMELLSQEQLDRIYLVAEAQAASDARKRK